MRNGRCDSETWHNITTDCITCDGTGSITVYIFITDPSAGLAWYTTVVCGKEHCGIQLSVLTKKLTFVQEIANCNVALYSDNNKFLLWFGLY